MRLLLALLFVIECYTRDEASDSTSMRRYLVLIYYTIRVLKESNLSELRTYSNGSDKRFSYRWHQLLLFLLGLALKKFPFNPAGKVSRDT